MGIPVYFVGRSRGRCDTFKELCHRSGGVLTFSGSWIGVLQNADQILPAVQDLKPGWLVIEVRLITPQGCFSLVPEDDATRKGKADNDRRVYSVLKELKNALNCDTRILAIASLNRATPAYHQQCIDAGAFDFLYDEELWYRESLQGLLANPRPRAELEIKRLTLRPRLLEVQFAGGTGSPVFPAIQIQKEPFVWLYYLTLGQLVGADDWMSPHDTLDFMVHTELLERIRKGLDDPDLKDLSDLAKGNNIAQSLTRCPKSYDGGRIKVHVSGLNSRVQMAAYRFDCKELITQQDSATGGRRKGYKLDVPTEGIDFDFSLD